MTTVEPKPFDAFITHRPFIGSEIAGGVANVVVNAVDGGSVYSIDPHLSDGRIRKIVEEKFTQYLIGSRHYAANWRDVNELLWFLLHGMVDIVEEYDLRGVREWRQSKEGIARALANPAIRNLGMEDDIRISVQDYQIDGTGRTMLIAAYEDSPELFEKILDSLTTVYFGHTPFFNMITYHEVARLHDGKLLQERLKSHVKNVLFHNTTILQTREDLEGLVQLAEHPEILGAKVEKEGEGYIIRFRDINEEMWDLERVTLAVHHHIGFDIDNMERLADARNVRHSFNDEHQYIGQSLLKIIEEEQKKGKDVFVMYGRADPTKAGDEAVGWFYDFARTLKEHGRNPSLIVCAEETRDGIDAYDDQMLKYERSADWLNESWNNMYDDALVTFIPEKIPRKVLIKSFTSTKKRQPAHAVLKSKRDGWLLIVGEAAYIASRDRGNFVITGDGTGIGRHMDEYNLSDGRHGVYVTKTNDPNSAYNAAMSFLNGGRTDETVMNHLKEQNLKNWVIAQEIAAAKAKELQPIKA